MTKEEFALKVKFYGTRGSIPVCARNFQDFGGNTSCIAITTPDPTVLSVIDAGTGIRNLGKDLAQPGTPKLEEVTIGFSHFHWDHIQGFPFFSPAYDHKLKINILMMGRRWKNDQLKEILIKQMGGEFFPVELDKMGAHFNFVSLGRRVVQRSTGMSVRAQLHAHPGGAYGFRFERNGKVMVYITDIEHGDTIDPETIQLSKDADLLIHEAQYTSQQLRDRRGWGHSSFEQAIEVARQAGVKKLVMTHHDPDHDDAFLLNIEKKCQAIFADCALAREGMELSI